MRKPFIFIMLIALVGFPVFAATESKDVVIKVSVDSSLTLTSSISSISTITTLDNSIGNVTIFSNVSAWVLTVKSVNGGYLKAENKGNTDHYPYTITVGSASGIDLSNAANNYTYMLSGSASSATYPISVQFANTPTTLGLSAGSYTDQLFITLATS